MRQVSDRVVHPQYASLQPSPATRVVPDPTAVLDARITEEAWACTYCERNTLELVWWEKQEREGKEGAVFVEVRRRTIWPEQVPRALKPEVPENIRDLFDEAARTESAGALRLAGAGYRSVVEAICKEQGTSGNNLFERVTDLGTQLPPELVQALHDARVVGNDSLHDGLQYAPEEVADIAELIIETTLVLYVHPAQRKKMSAARAARRAQFKAGKP